MNRVATSIGTKVYYGFEAESGTRPTLRKDYTHFEDCTSHPDFNPEREQIETTTLAQENNKTYTQGLKDFGALEFGFNLTQKVLDQFLAKDTGIIDMAKKLAEEGKRMWICVDIKYINKSFYIPVEPQDFGLPAGNTNSKYELTVRFNVIDDAGWYDDLVDEPVAAGGTTNSNEPTE